jgi:cytochrome c1
VLAIGVAAIALAGTGCRGGRADAGYDVPTGGDPHRGAVAIRNANCGSCHTIPGIREANGVVGPPLFFFSRRTFIAGLLPNTPANLVQWVMDPRSIEPRTAMPKLDLTERQARDIAAYLYTLR